MYPKWFCTSYRRRCGKTPVVKKLSGLQRRKKKDKEKNNKYLQKNIDRKADFNSLFYIIFLKSEIIHKILDGLGYVF